MTVINNNFTYFDQIPDGLLVVLDTVDSSSLATLETTDFVDGQFVLLSDGSYYKYNPTATSGDISAQNGGFWDVYTIDHTNTFINTLDSLSAEQVESLRNSVVGYKRLFGNINHVKLPTKHILNTRHLLHDYSAASSTGAGVWEDNQGGYDLSQTTTSFQPTKNVDGSLAFDGASDRFDLFTGSLSFNPDSDNYTSFYVFKHNDTTQAARLLNTGATASSYRAQGVTYNQVLNTLSLQLNGTQESQFTNLNITEGSVISLAVSVSYEAGVCSMRLYYGGGQVVEISGNRVATASDRFSVGRILTNGNINYGQEDVHHVSFAGELTFDEIEETRQGLLKRYAPQDLGEIDVWFAAGQSNMVGLLHDDVFTGFSGQEDILMSDGRSGDGEFTEGGSFGTGVNESVSPALSFAVRMSEAGRKTAVIQYAVGGTSINQDSGAWSTTAPVVNPTVESGVGHAYQNAVRLFNSKIEELIGLGYTPVIRGLLWWQGESDASLIITSSAFKANLKKLISAFRLSLNEASLPIVAVRIDWGGDELPYEAVVRQSIEEVANEDHNVVWLDIDEFDSMRVASDDYHHNLEARIAIGEKMADVVMGVTSQN